MMRIPFLNKIKKPHPLLAALLLFSIGSASGYYLSPTKIEVKEKVVQVEKLVEVEKVVEKKAEASSEAKDSSSFSRKVSVVRPDGTSISIETEGRMDKEIKEVVRIEYVDRVKERVVEKQKLVEVQKAVERDLPQWRAGAMVGVDLLSAPDAALPTSTLFGGATVERRVVGPFWAGIWGTSNGMFGASISLEF